MIVPRSTGHGLAFKVPLGAEASVISTSAIAWIGASWSEPNRKAG